MWLDPELSRLPQHCPIWWWLVLLLIHKHLQDSSGMTVGILSACGNNNFSWDRLFLDRPSVIPLSRPLICSAQEGSFYLRKSHTMDSYARAWIHDRHNCHIIALGQDCLAFPFPAPDCCCYHEAKVLWSLCHIVQCFPLELEPVVPT